MTLLSFYYNKTHEKREENFIKPSCFIAKPFSLRKFLP